MQVLINEQTVIIPSTLAEFTLGQRILFQQQHGNDLDSMAKSINDMPENEEKEFQILLFNFEKMFRTFSFFSNVPVEVLKESEFIDDIAALYYASAANLFEQEENIELQQTFFWKGEEWELAPPVVRQNSKMKFAEIIESKQIVQNMQELGKSHWESLLPLCAIFFRKKDEPYQESFVYEDSERLKLMEELPMEYALQVGFFLLACQNIYLNTSPYSSRVK